MLSTESVSKYELWQKENPTSDTLIVAMCTHVSTLTVDTLLRKFCPDIFFVERSTENENSTNVTQNISTNDRSYIYHDLAKQAGLYYDSLKLELVALIINTSNSGTTLMNEVSDKSIQADTTFDSQEYSVLFRRKYTEQEKKQIATEYDRLPVYSFIATSYRTRVARPEDSEEKATDVLWKYVSEIQRKIRPTPTSLFPIVLAIYGDTGVGTKNEELPKTWVCCNNQTGKSRNRYEQELLVLL